MSSGNITRKRKKYNLNVTFVKKKMLYHNVRIVLFEQVYFVITKRMKIVYRLFFISISIDGFRLNCKF